MHLWYEHLLDRQKPFAASGRAVAAALLAALLLFTVPGVLAEDGEEPFAVSFAGPAGYPAPDVPESAAVNDSYFRGAVLVGDSMAESFDIYGVVPDLTVISEIGASARTAHDYSIFEVDGQSYRLRDLLAQMNPPIVYLWLGSNGVDAKPSAQVLEDYERLLNQLIPALPDTLIYCMALPPVHALALEQYPNYTNARVNAFNEGLRELCKSHGVYFLDITGLLRHESGELDVEYAAGDGIHLKRAAYDLLANYLYTHTIPVERTEEP